MDLSRFKDGLWMKVTARLDDGLGLIMSSRFIRGGRPERTALDGAMNIGGANGITQQRHDLEVERGHQCFDMCFDTHVPHKAKGGQLLRFAVPSAVKTSGITVRKRIKAFFPDAREDGPFVPDDA